ncbi:MULTISPECIES: YidC/Oxa1 family membrane protein insertase [unclassified Clostridium]|uniref:YidC/Oxa1 family membrane protein insertase n=1 Tax=unclassified Clostridium TaxID=2614128 RepID=UPI00291237E5|nr:membrane protein insertase YidC [Clostridium sp.]MDU5108070.1 membrane protein insertase YidC [Clostridium sp.]
MDVIINIFKYIVEFFYQFTGDYGIAIVLLTIIVKIFMLPFSIKQRIAMKKQITFSKKIDEVKAKYKTNRKRQEEELNKLYSENSKGLLGCLLPILQLPIISGLYMSIDRLKLEAMSILVPWAINIGNTDDKFLVSIIYTLITVLPSLISYLKVFGNNEEIVKPKSILPMIIMGVLITFKAPIALGIYFITSSLFNLLEDIGFRIYSKGKRFA